MIFDGELRETDRSGESAMVKHMDWLYWMRPTRVCVNVSQNDLVVDGAYPQALSRVGQAGRIPRRAEKGQGLVRSPSLPRSIR